MLKCSTSGTVLAESSRPPISRLNFARGKGSISDKGRWEDRAHQFREHAGRQTGVWPEPLGQLMKDGALEPANGVYCGATGTKMETPVATTLQFRMPQLISRDFVKLWEPQYDTGKYPADFYLCHSANARNAGTPELLKNDLLALLHWKDGKALSFAFGETHAKPNTLDPILTLTGSALADLWRSFADLVQADESGFTACTERLRDRFSQMWTQSSSQPFCFM